MRGGVWVRGPSLGEGPAWVRGLTLALSAECQPVRINFLLGPLGPILSIQSVILQNQSEYTRIKLSKNRGMSTNKEFGTSSSWSINT